MRKALSTILAAFAISAHAQPTFVPAIPITTWCVSINNFDAWAWQRPIYIEATVITSGPDLAGLPIKAFAGVMHDVKLGDVPIKLATATTQWDNIFNGASNRTTIDGLGMMLDAGSTSIHVYGAPGTAYWYVADIYEGDIPAVEYQVHLAVQKSTNGQCKVAMTTAI